ncbi:hypothetical protein L596_023908 [Steinernema carpocapsae]|uniref:Uncharacterized protein n=1 Tax=Steinernema carpocapsae TaxID=34508 RepID=A0A4U5MF46_STECR|nr:hypothetical protein L596_023897 [Steinernema carpocapsae]TKR67817.1 hypothetical protein L596_023908 [Steinernema carpocapsae]
MVVRKVGVDAHVDQRLPIAERMIHWGQEPDVFSGYTSLRLDPQRSDRFRPDSFGAKFLEAIVLRVERGAEEAEPFEFEEEFVLL